MESPLNPRLAKRILGQIETLKTEKPPGWRSEALDLYRKLEKQYDPFIDHEDNDPFLEDDGSMPVAEGDENLP